MLRRVVVKPSSVFTLTELITILTRDHLHIPREERLGATGGNGFGTQFEWFPLRVRESTSHEKRRGVCRTRNSDGDRFLLINGHSE